MKREEINVHKNKEYDIIFITLKDEKLLTIPIYCFYSLIKLLRSNE